MGEHDGFGIENLPFGVFRRPGHEPRVGVAYQDQVLALAVLAETGLLPGLGTVFRRPSLNAFLDLGRSAWDETRGRLQQVITDDDLPAAARVPLSDVELLLPVEIGDYVDFFSSIHHATNVGRLFRPDVEPLFPNWRHLPVGYHGRAGTVVVSGTPIIRPRGQRLTDGEVVYGPSRSLDFELEVGFIAGPGNPLGAAIEPDRVADHIFGIVLLNDWSARDIQAFEYQPLGPFLGKSFATSISPWVVPLTALEPYRCSGPTQEPPPAAHLLPAGAWGFDLALGVTVSGTSVAGTAFADQYWNIAHQLAHLTSNGSTIRPGDLLASGTVSGPESGSWGSLLEATFNGTRPLNLAGGRQLGYLADGDEVVMSGRAAADGRPAIDLGSVTGRVTTSPDT